MLSRALSLATAMLLIGFAIPSSLIAPASAQNLEAGKSPAQLFNGNCGVCHKSARGLLKSVPPGQLPGFLRQHYTTSSDMAKAMSAYVIANGTGGGGGSRRGSDDGLTRQGRELTREQAPAPAEAAPGDRRLRPSAAERQQLQPGPDGVPAAEQTPRRSRTKRQPPAEAAPAGEVPTAAETERPVTPKQKGKKNRRHQDEPKADTAKDEPAKSEPAKPEPARSEPPKEAAPVKPAEESKPAEAAKPEPKPEAPAATRTDPVPAVTPAPKEPEPAAPAPAAPPPAAVTPSEPNAE